MTEDLFWTSPPENVIVAGDEVHVWRVALDQPGTSLDRLRRVLSVDEMERAQGFHFDKDRHAFIVARGALRTILGRYLDMAAGDVRFCYNPYGKPALARELGAIRFNLSHSGNLALCAVARDRDVGIDVERIRRVPKFEQIASRYFSARERSELGTLPADQKLHAFFSCWTRKEAYIKARGQGLSLPLDRFSVSLRPGVPATITRCEKDPRDVRFWSLRDVCPGGDYVAAVAAEGKGWHPKGLRWCA